MTGTPPARPCPGMSHPPLWVARGGLPARAHATCDCHWMWLVRAAVLDVARRADTSGGAA